MSTTGYLQSNCEHCGSYIEYPPELAGQSGECPRCQQSTALPASSASRPAIRRIPTPVATAQLSAQQPKISGVEKVIRFGGLAIIGLIFLLIIIGSFLDGGGGNDNKFDAYYTATTLFVPSHLKAPGSAKFASYQECSVDVVGDVYTVSGWVDAQNSFGALIRQRFTCEMRIEESRGKWVHINTVIY